MNAEVRLVLDASNFARISNEKSDPTRFFAVIDEIAKAVDGRKHHLYIVWDHRYKKHFAPAAQRKIDNWDPKSKKVNAEQVTAPTGIEADEVVLKWAQDRPGSIVLSSDGYTDYHEHKYWLLEPGRFVCGTYTQHDKRWLLTERQIHQNGPGPITRQLRRLSELLDDLYPTTRSVFRELRLSKDQIKDFSVHLDLSVPETAIISKDVAEWIRKVVGQLLEYRTNLRPLLNGSSVSERDALQWLALSGYSAVQRDGDYYVSHEVATEVQKWLTGQFPTLSAFRLKLAIDSGDVESVRRLVNDLDFEGQTVLAMFGQTWVNLADGSTEIDWTAIESLDSLFLTFLVEKAIEKNLIDEGFNLPADRIAELSPPLNNQLLAKRYRASNNIDDVIAFYSSYVGHVEEDRELQKEAGQWILDVAFDQKQKWSKRKWKLLSDAVSRAALYSPEHVVSYYFSGNHERALTGMYTSDKKLTKRLRLHYLNEVVAMPWMSPDSLGLFLLNTVLRNYLIAGDYESFLASEEVMDTAVKNIDQIDPESQWSDLVFARAVELKLRPLCSSINNAIDVLDKFTFESRS